TTSRVQVDVSDLQQSVRQGQYDMVRVLRMAGRGNVPLELSQPMAGAPSPQYAYPNGIAVSVKDNVPANTFMDPGQNYRVLAGTDVLTVRGVINTPVYAITQNTPLVIRSTNPAATPNGGTIVVPASTRNGIPQNLQPLSNAIAAGLPEALVLVSRVKHSDYQIVTLDPPNCIVGANSITVSFVIGPVGAFTNPTPVTAAWGLSNSRFSPTLTDVDTIGIVEEYSYYVRDLREVAGNQSSPPIPQLVRARVYPGTQTPWNNDTSNWAVPIADNVTDLQVALGIEAGGTSPYSLDEGAG